MRSSSQPLQGLTRNYWDELTNCLPSRFSYINSLYIVASALTGTGLSPVDFFASPTGAQVIVYFLCCVAGSVAESAYPLLLRLFRVWRAKVRHTKPRCELSSLGLYLVRRISIGRETAPGFYSLNKSINYIALSE